MNSFLRFAWMFFKGLVWGLLFLLVVAVAAFGFLGYTATGNQFLARQIAQAASTQDLKISLEGARGLMQGNFKLATVNLSDSKGEFARVEGLDLAWQPSALLKMRFHAEGISAAKVVFLRPPVTSRETPPAEQDGSFSLPIEIAVDRIDLPLVALGKAVAGRDTELALSGSAKAVTDQISLDLKANEKARPQAGAIAKLSYGVNSRTLALDARVTEPQGGLLARALTLPGTPPVEIAVKGEGPLDAWQGSISGKVAGQPVLALTGSHVKTPKGMHTLQVEGGGQIAELLPPALRSLFAGDTKVDVDAEFNEAGLVRINSGSIANDSLSVSAQGKLDPDGDAALQADIRPAGQTIGLTLPLASGELNAALNSASVQLSGPFRQARLNISAAVDHVTTPDAGATGITLKATSPAFDLQSKAGPLVVTATVEKTAFRSPEAAKLVQGPLKIDGAMDIDPEVIDVEKIAIESPKLGGTISGEFKPMTQEVVSNLQLFVLPDALLPPDLAAKAEGTIALSGKVAATLPDKADITDLKIASNLVSTEGTASYNAGALKASLRGALANLSLFQPDIAGNVEFAVDVSGQATAPVVAALVNSPEIRAGGQTLTNVDVKLDATADPKGPKGKVSATVTALGQKVDTAANFALANGTVSLPSVSVRTGNNTLVGAVELDKTFKPSGKFDIDLADIGALAAVAKQQAEGALKGTFELVTSDGKTSGTLKLAGAKLASQGAEITEPNINVSIADLNAKVIDANVTAKSVSRGANKLDEVDLKATVDGAVTRFDLASRFDNAPLTATGTVEPKDGATAITLASFAAAPRKVPVKLASPATVTVRDGAALIDGIVIAAGDGTVTVKGTAGKVLDIEAKVDALPAALANTFARDLGAEGTLSAIATVKGASSAPVVAFDARLTGASTAQTRARDLQNLDVTAKGQLADNVLNADLVTTLKGQPAHAAARVDLSGEAVDVPSIRVTLGETSVTGNVALDKAMKASGRFDFDIPDIARLAEIAGQKAEGALKGSVDFAQTDKGVKATVASTGSLRGQPIAIDLDAVTENGAVSLPTLKVNVGSNTVSGTVNLNDQFLPTGNIDFDLPDLALLAAMAGQTAEGSLKGKASIASAEQKITTTVDATGAIRGQEIALDLQAVSDNGAVSLPALSVKAGANTLSGAIAFDRSFKPNGKIDIDLSDIGALAAIAQQQASGALKGTFQLATTGGTTSGTLNLAGTKLAAQGAEIAAPRISASIADLNARNINVKVTAQAITQGANKLDDIDLKARIEGPVTRFDLASRFDNAPLTLSGSVEPKDDVLSITLASFAATPKRIPVELKGPATIAVRDGVATIEGVAIKAGDGTVTVKGTASKVLDIEAKVDALPAALANTFARDLGAEGTLSATATVKGASSAPVVAFDARLTGASTAQTRARDLQNLDVTAKGQLADNVLNADLATTLKGQPAHAAARVDLSGEAVDVPSIRVTLGETSVTGNVALDRAMKASGRFDFDIPDIARLAEIAGQKAEGALKGSVDFAQTDKGVKATVASTGSLRGQPIAIDLDAVTENGAVSLPALKVNVGSNTVSGTVNLNDQFLPTGHIDFDLPDLALLAAMAGQTAEGSLKGKASIASAEQKITTTVDATGAIRGQEVLVNVQAVSDKGAISLPALKLDVGKNTVDGAITLDQNFMPSGKVDFNLPDIGLLAAMAGQKAEGAIAGMAEIRSADGRITGTIKANGPKVVSNGVEVAKPVVDLTIADLSTGQISGKVTADRIASGANQFARLALDFDRQGPATAFNLSSQYDGAPMLAKGSVEQQAGGTLSLKLASFSAAPRKIPVKLNAPIEVKIARGNVAFSNVTITAGRGNISASGSAGRTLDIEAKISALPASLANTFSSGLDAAGTINANVTVSGASSAPTIAFDTNVQNASIAQIKAAGLRPLAISAKGRLARNVLSIDTSVRNPDGLTLTARGTVGVAGTMPLSINVNGQLPFTAAGAQLAAQGIALKGDARFNLSVKGAASRPQISGSITSAGGTLTLIRQNLVIKNLSANLSLAGEQVRITRISGELDGGGTLNVAGTVGFAPNSGFPADLRIDLKNAVYVDGSIVAAKVSGDLNVRGKLVSAPALAGRIRVHRADITIPQKLPGALSQIKVKHKNAPRDVAIQSAEIRAERAPKSQRREAGGINLDLVISAPRQIFVRGRGLDTELGGELTIKGTSGAPNVSGGFKMVRGRLAIIGRRLDFTTGIITFGGGLMPYLNMVASTSVNSTTINVTVNGPANDPTFAFTSSPALPQDEVLAQLIFGRSSSSLSAVQIAQLADAVAQLAGGTNNSLFNRLRQGLGVDDLDIGTDENGKTNVSAGKYLNKRTYIELQQGDTSKAVINLDIGKGVKLKGEAGADGSTATGIFYEKEY